MTASIKGSESYIKFKTISDKMNSFLPLRTQSRRKVRKGRTYTEFHRGDTEFHRDLLRKLQAIQGDCFATLAMTNPATITQHPAP
jgi:hypothetical protein